MKVLKFLIYCEKKSYPEFAKSYRNCEKEKMKVMPVLLKLFKLQNCMCSARNA